MSSTNDSGTMTKTVWVKLYIQGQEVLDGTARRSFSVEVSKPYHVEALAKAIIERVQPKLNYCHDYDLVVYKSGTEIPIPVDFPTNDDDDVVPLEGSDLVVDEEEEEEITTEEEEEDSRPGDKCWIVVAPKKQQQQQQQQEYYHHHQQPQFLASPAAAAQQSLEAQRQLFVSTLNAQQMAMFHGLVSGVNHYYYQYQQHNNNNNASLLMKDNIMAIADRAQQQQQQQMEAATTTTPAQAEAATGWTVQQQRQSKKKRKSPEESTTTATTMNQTAATTTETATAAAATTTTTTDEEKIDLNEFDDGVNRDSVKNLETITARIEAYKILKARLPEKGTMMTGGARKWLMVSLRPALACLENHFGGDVAAYEKAWNNSTINWTMKHPCGGKKGQDCIALTNSRKK